MVSAKWDGWLWSVQLADSENVAADRIWLATGTQPCLDPLLQRFSFDHPVALVDGLPVLELDLRWPSTRVHLAGRLATLRLGPRAGNLAGARRAAERIVASVSGRPIVDAVKAHDAVPCPATASTATSTTRLAGSAPIGPAGG